MALKRLPIEGSILKELKVYGNAKNCDVKFQTTNPSWEIYFAMRDPAFQIELRGNVQSIIFEEGSDKCLGVKYLPLERLRVQRCLVDHPGTETEWQKVLEDLQGRDVDAIDWMLSSAQLAIVPA